MPNERTWSLPLKWHGGKQYLADRIIELMPPHIHYVEPFAGGLAVLFRKPYEGVSEVVNDLNYWLTNFWKVLADEELFAQFQRKIEATPFSENEWADSDPDDANTHPLANWARVESAVAFFIRYRQSRQGLGQDFATLSRNRTRRGMNEQVSSWLSAIEGLPQAHERLKRVVIYNRNAMDVIRQQDGANTLFYLDPPYLHDTRAVTDAYECEMDSDDHKALLDELDELQGKFILSGYHSAMYDQYASSCDWRCVEIEIDNKASGATTKRKMTECLWMNY